MHAGHGLNYHNVQPVAAIPPIVELNIGHAIIAHALFVGLRRRWGEMKRLMLAARRMIYGIGIDVLRSSASRARSSASASTSSSVC